jgi:sugar phosphate isomerase/epimerase
MKARPPRLVSVATPADPSRDRQELSRRLGLNVPAAWWPTAHALKGLEAAGFAWVQVHAPPRSVLADRRRARAHAAALRANLETCGLQLILHGPDDLCAGDSAHEPALDGLIAYAQATRARYVVYHGANLPLVDGGAAAARVSERLAREERALRARAGRIESAGFTLAIENLAPVWPGPAHLCHSPEFVRELVSRLDCPQIGMLLDVGHANIAAGITGGHLRAMVASVAERVVLFDLHLAPGAGRLPWHAIAALLVDHSAPLMLEVHPPHRPEALSLANVTSELLLRDRRAVGASLSTLARGVDPAQPTVPLG